MIERRPWESTPVYRLCTGGSDGLAHVHYDAEICEAVLDVDIVATVHGV